MKLKFGVDTYSRKVLFAIAMGGCFALRDAEIIGNKITIQRIIRRMKEEKYVLSFSDPYKYVILTQKGQNILREMSPECAAHYEDAEPRKLTSATSASERQKLRRHLQQSEISNLFSSLGIYCWSFDKPALSLENRDKPLDDKDLIYYNSKEIKRIDSGKSSNKVQHTRNYGLLFSPGGIYLIYHVGNGKQEWSQYGENKAVVEIEEIVANNYNSNLRIPINKAIVFVLKYDALPELLLRKETPLSKTKHEFFTIDNIFENMYILPLNIHGQLVMRMMILKDHHERIIDYLFDETYKKTDGNIAIDCDVYREDEYYISFLESNVSRLKRFRQSMQFSESSKFHIYCFAWQAEMLKNYLPSDCNIHLVNEIDVYTKLFNIRRKDLSK